MERRMYQMTERQAALPTSHTIPSDDEIKVIAKKARKPWGIVKRDLSLQALRRTHDYTLGLWQGRVDAARGLEYSEERFNSEYNLGYHDGYLGYASDRKGWDKGTRERFDNLYVN